MSDHVEITTLGNGLRIISEHMPLEHMAFKGTARRSALAIAEEIERVGGSLNAYTSREHTAYYARILADDVGLAADILADILRNSSFDPAELEKERHVVLQEIGQVKDTPDDLVHDLLQDASYPDQPMGRFGPGQLLAMLNRGDYWQCGYVIAKGSLDQLRQQGLPAFREAVAGLVSR